jgi:MFS family permease
MNTLKKIFKYPLQIYIFFLISFVTGVEFIGPFLIPFFREWGGLTQFETQLLQSWFMLWIFLLEIPTGLIGDIKGRKFSVMTGLIFLTVGVIIYALFPSFWLFMFGEFLLAFGVAFISGSDEALLYDSVVDLKLKDQYGKISNTYENLKFYGMILSSLVAGLFIGHLGYNQIFQLSAIGTGVAAILLFFFIKEPKFRKEGEEFAPDYLGTFKLAFKEFRNNKSLLRLTLMTTIINSIAYFSIWLNQNLLDNIGITKEFYGFFRTYGILIQIGASSLMLFLLKPKGTRLTVHSLIILIIIVGFLAGGLITNVYGTILFLTLVMGFGMKHRTVMGQYMNSKIESTNRATVLSFVSMSRRVLLIFLNPLIGFFVDINLGYTLAGLGLILLIPLIFIKLKPEDLSIDG